MFWLSKRPGKWVAPPLSRTLRHKIGATGCSGCPSVRENGPNACFPGHYDTKSGLQGVLAVQASIKMARTPVFPDATTQNRGYRVFWLSKRPGKWVAPPLSRTLRHKIGATGCSGCPSVRENGPNACFPGHYDTKSGLQGVLAVQASIKMARTPVFPDATTKNRAYSIFWQSKRPQKWAERLFPRTLRHIIRPTACFGCSIVR